MAKGGITWQPTLFIILSKFSPEALQDPKDFKQIAAVVVSKIKGECPGVVWKSSFATLGRFDVKLLAPTGGASRKGSFIL
jgi:uncharacterized protein with GYD domain